MAWPDPFYCDGLFYWPIHKEILFLVHLYITFFITIYEKIINVIIFQ